MAEIPILLISLRQSSDRFEFVKKELSRFELSPQRVAAVDGRRKASLLQRASGRNFFDEPRNRSMTPGEIGCFASHFKALRQIIRNRTPKAIILEDDAVFNDQFGNFYRNDLPGMLDSVDIVKLEGLLYSHTSRNGITVFRSANCRGIVPMKPSAGAAGYAVTLRGARSLVDVMKRCTEPYDFILNGYERYPASYCEVRPFLIAQSGVGSIIGDVGRDIDARNRNPDVTDKIRQSAHRVAKAIRRGAKAGRTWLAFRLPAAR